MPYYPKIINEIGDICCDGNITPDQNDYFENQIEWDDVEFEPKQAHWINEQTEHEITLDNFHDYRFAIAWENRKNSDGKRYLSIHHTGDHTWIYELDHSIGN